MLKALSRRIHYGKFVAEVKFRDSIDEYKPFILAQVSHYLQLIIVYSFTIHTVILIIFDISLLLQDRDALMKLLTFEAVEEMVKKRVAKKAKVFGQEVSLNDNAEEVKGKIDPLLVSRLYDEWVMPLTKLVEVEYLLRRLD